MTLLPIEFVRSLACASFLQYCTPLLIMTYLYSSPADAYERSLDQFPSPSAASIVEKRDQLLKSPTSATASAFGAHVRKLTPSSASLTQVPRNTSMSSPPRSIGLPHGLLLEPPSSLLRKIMKLVQSFVERFPSTFTVTYKFSASCPTIT